MSLCSGYPIQDRAISVTDCGAEKQEAIHGNSHSAHTKIIKKTFFQFQDPGKKIFNFFSISFMILVFSVTTCRKIPSLLKKRCSRRDACTLHGNQLICKRQSFTNRTDSISSTAKEIAEWNM